MGGRLVTTPARTAVDVARRRGVLPGLLVWEAARWRARTDGTLADFDEEADDCLRLLKGRKGIDRARQTRAIVMRHEKRRQESMEAEGWTFARWGKEEVRQPWRLKHVVERAFALAAGRQLPRQVHDLLESTRGAPGAISTR